MSKLKDDDVNEEISCGLVMPISETENFSEAHWKNVLKLLHRVIQSAGFDPKNVWESSSTDRISERIVGNLFNLPIVVVDISDLNPNVMFELGLRLSSKKPTVVVCNEGGAIPFDISDFEALFYPSDLNIIGMEDFFRKLEHAISQKYENFKKNNYQPFLSTVIIDVASPQTREVGLNDLIISRLDELSRKVANLQTRPVSVRSRGRSTTLLERGRFYVEIPIDQQEEFEKKASEISAVDEMSLLSRGATTVTLELNVSWVSLREAEKDIMQLAESLGGGEGLPF